MDSGAERLETSDPAVSSSSTGNRSETVEECRDNTEKVAEEVRAEAEGESAEIVQIMEGRSVDEQTEKAMKDMKLTDRSSSLNASEEKKAEVQEQKAPNELADERGDSAITENFGSNRDDNIPALERDSTFGSQDFRSVENWIGSESDEGASESLSMDTGNPKMASKINSLEPDHAKILRKVDELRDELSSFITKTVEGERTSHFKHQPSRIPSSGQPPRSPCLHHPRNLYSRAEVPPYIQKGQREGNGVEELPRNERKLAVKSHCRPVTGGAPFVVCYVCWRLLQLPADFLVTQKRLHKLRCGSCHKVLVFSFRPRARTAPMTPVEMQHPPSEADNNNDRAGWDPISYSDDYGTSYVQNHSSEGEQALHVSESCSYSIQGRDGEDVRPQLHCLMGYSSARQLLFRPSSVNDGSQSSESSTPQFYVHSHEKMTNWLKGTGYITPNSAEIEEEDEQQERVKNRRRGLALKRLLKKGVHELSHGVQTVKHKIQPKR